MKVSTAMVLAAVASCTPNANDGIFACAVQADCATGFACVNDTCQQLSTTATGTTGGTTTLGTTASGGTTAVGTTTTAASTTGTTTGTTRSATSSGVTTGTTAGSTGGTTGAAHGATTAGATSSGTTSAGAGTTTVGGTTSAGAVTTGAPQGASTAGTTSASGSTSGVSSSSSGSPTTGGLSFGCALSYAAEVLADSPALYYHFDEPAGSTTVIDSSGNGLNGSYIDDAGLVVLGNPGTIGTCATFTNGGLARYAPSSTLQGDYSIELWTNPTSSKDGEIVSTRQGSAPVGSFDIQNDNGGSGGLHGDIFGLNTTLSAGANSSLALPVGQWSHIVYVVTLTGYTIYQDGAVTGSGAYSGTPVLWSSGNTFDIAGSPIFDYSPSDNYFYSGAIDELAVYPSALSAARVSAHYQAASCPQTAATTSTGGTTGGTTTGTGSSSGAGTSSGGSSGTTGGGQSSLGCADGTREGFSDSSLFPSIAACNGGWSIPGLPSPSACGGASGNDSLNPAGSGCAAADLCSAGFHLCTSANDVASHLPTGHTCAEVTSTAGLFYATLQSGPACQSCSGADGTVCQAMVGDGSDCTTPVTDDAGLAACVNDLFGCGTAGGTPGGNCGVLNEWSGGSCSDLSTDWQCTSNLPNSDYMELLTVTKPDSNGGGVLCCAN